MGKCFSLTEEQRNKIRLARLGTHASAEAKAKMSASHKGKRHTLGYKHTEQARRNMGLAHVGNQNNLGHKASPETRAKMSLAHSGSNNGFFGRSHSEASKEKMRAYRLGKPTTLGRKASEETRVRISASKKGQPVQPSATRSDTYKAMWQDKEWAEQQVQRIVKSRCIRPNKAENLLTSILNEAYPGHWKYVGNGEMFIGRYNPDFVNVNGKKQIIELFGDYWHKGEDETIRIGAFAEYGFATLIIWEHELRDTETLLAKLQKFSDCGVCQSRASKSGDALGKRRDDTRSIPLRDEERVRA